MSLQDVVNDPPSASDLAWEADRLSLADLPREQREWFENLAKAIHEAWPDDDVDLGEGDLDPDEHGDKKCFPLAWYVELEAKLLDPELKIPLEIGADREEAFDVDEIIAAVKSAIEQAREEGVKDATIPSRANTAQRKAMRLLVEGRVSVNRRDTTGQHAGLVVAEVRGDSGEVYTLGFDPHRRQWRCTCQELKGQCSHLLAVKMIAPTMREDPAA